MHSLRARHLHCAVTCGLRSAAASCSARPARPPPGHTPHMFRAPCAAPPRCLAACASCGTRHSLASCNSRVPMRRRASFAAELADCATRGGLSSSVCVLVQNRHGHQLPGRPPSRTDAQINPLHGSRPTSVHLKICAHGQGGHNRCRCDASGTRWRGHRARLRTQGS